MNYLETKPMFKGMGLSLSLEGSVCFLQRPIGLEL